MQDIVAAEGVEITPAVKEEIWGGLRNLAAGPREQRTLTLLAATIQDQSVKSALAALHPGRTARASARRPGQQPLDRRAGRPSRWPS